MEESGASVSESATATCLNEEAQDVAFVLITLGWVVLPHGPDMAFWRIGDLIFTDDDLLGFAARHGVHPPPARLQ